MENETDYLRMANKRYAIFRIYEEIERIQKLMIITGIKDNLKTDQTYRRKSCIIQW